KYTRLKRAATGCGDLANGYPSANTDRGQAMAIGGSSGIATRHVSPADVRAMLRDAGEMALLDVREEGVFSEQGHPFFANSVPLSRLGITIPHLRPPKATPDSGYYRG